VPIIVTRGFNAIGPGQDERFVVSGFAKQLAAVAAGEFPAISVGNLTAQRDFLDVRDVAEAYVALWERGEPGEVYNVCSGKATAIADVLRSLIAATGREVDVRQDPARMRPSDLPVSYGDSSKLSAATGWAPVISLAASLRDAYDDAVARRHAA
jgi:GDP-4-dehydro-6-deoxy-D-mannose reductase